MITGQRAFALAFAALGAVTGCTHQGYDTQHLPDGTLRLKCEGALPACLSHAEDVCRGSTYEVVRARDQRDHFGPEAGTAQIEVRSSEAIIRCSNRPASANAATPPTSATGPGSDTNQTPPASAPSAPPAAPRACVPGATQACIGPGRCEGGQSCLPDGTAYGPCDCGTLGPPPVAPPAPGQAPAAAPSSPNTTAPGGPNTPSAPHPGAKPVAPGTAPSPLKH